MIRVHVKQALIDGPVVHHELDVPAATVRDVLAEFWRPEWDTDYFLAVDGEVQRDLEALITDGSDVVLGPDIRGTLGFFYGYFVSLKFLWDNSAVANALALDTPYPQSRGDQESPTYDWGGISNTSGPGFSVPLPYGRFRLAGHVIYTDIVPSVFRNGGEVLKIIVAVGLGPILGWGDTPSFRRWGDFDDLGAISSSTQTRALPDGIRVGGVLVDHTSDTPGVRAWLRTGRETQRPIPAANFPGIRTTETVDSEVDDEGDEAVYEIGSADELSVVDYLLQFPRGLYRIDGNRRVSTRVTFTVSWRPAGAGAWRLFQRVFGFSLFGVSLTPFSSKINAELPPGVVGPIEVRIRRVTPAGDSQTVNAARWRQVVYGNSNTFSYPGIALMALEVEAGPDFQGTLPTITSLVNGRLVRMWDDSLGWSAPTFQNPGAPWDFEDPSTPPGRNPAWIALDYAMHPEGGDLDASKLILDQFRAWSIWCADNPGPIGDKWDHARHSFDGVFDSPRPVEERFMALMRSGRAMPLRFGDQLGVRYQYRDAHSDRGSSPLITVPAKAPLQLFNDSNATDVQLDFVSNPGSSPATLVVYEFLNEDLDFLRDDAAIADPASNRDDPTALVPDSERTEYIQTVGTVREAELQREGLFYHAVQRGIREELRFKTGPWALALLPGDLFDFAYEVLRPYDSVAAAMVVRVGGVGVKTITVDRNDLVVGGGTYRLHYRDPDGQSLSAEVVSVTDDEIEVLTSITVDAGAPAVFGELDKVVKTYELVDAGLEEDRSRAIVANEWTASIHDEVGPGQVAAAAQTVAPTSPFDAYAAPVVVTDVEVRPSVTPGRSVVSWVAPAALGGLSARVFLRRPPADGFDPEPWQLLGETQASELEIDDVVAFEAVEVAIAVESRTGHYAMPGAAGPQTLTRAEFPPLVVSSVQNLQIERAELGWLLAWDALESDVEYEVRIGTRWSGARVIYRGRVPRFVHEDPPAAAVHYQVAALAAHGLYSPRRAEITAGSAWAPETHTLAESVDEHGTRAGTFDGLEWDAAEGVIRIVAAELVGTYTGVELDLGYVAEVWFSVLLDVSEHDGTTIAELAGVLTGSGESLWRTVGARQASVGRPGLGWRHTIGDFAGVAIGDVQKTLGPRGYHGEPGSHVRASLESRFWDGAAWSPWEPHANGWRKAQKIQTRIRLGRETRTHQVKVHALEAAVYV